MILINGEKGKIRMPLIPTTLKDTISIPANGLLLENCRSKINKPAKSVGVTERAGIRLGWFCWYGLNTASAIFRFRSLLKHPFLNI